MFNEDGEMKKRVGLRARMGARLILQGDEKNGKANRESLWAHEVDKDFRVTERSATCPMQKTS